MFGKSVISPQATAIIQSIESHIEAYAPKTGGQKHGHLNSAVFYVLKGHGHDVHDGREIPWKAGDVMLVENGCVHQHFNDSETEECIHLVFKAKPLFLFMHLLLQKMVEWPPDLDPALGPVLAAEGPLMSRSSAMSAIEDKQQALSGNKTCNWRAEEIVKSLEFRKEYAKRPNVITAEEMPWERSPDGLIKHLIHRNMNTPELCVEAYMLFLKDGERSGKHRHMWEELAFVVEGEGYDLHWDMQFDCQDKFIWEWEAEPKKFEWKRGDYIYVPPYTNHQSFATSGIPHHRDEQPHHQGHGLRLDRPAGAGAGILSGSWRRQALRATHVNTTPCRRICYTRRLNRPARRALVSAFKEE